MPVHIERWIILVFSTLHQIICVQLLKVVLMAVCGPGVPLSVSVALENHLGAEFPAHVNLITTTKELLLERRSTCLQESVDEC